MNRTIIIICAVVLLPWVTALAKIIESDHDIMHYFGEEYGIEGGGPEACTFCHHPTNGESKQQQWDSSSLEDGKQTDFAVYYSGEEGSMPVCLSCHDGFTFDDDFDESAKADNHPVNFDYVSLSFQMQRFPYYDYRLGGVVGDSSGRIYPLENLQMVCITCHDPHAGEESFVRGGKDALYNSELCIDCHMCKYRRCN
jgi:hypothetical protein